MTLRIGIQLALAIYLLLSGRPWSAAILFATILF